jgi:hypothetical protein
MSAPIYRFENAASPAAGHSLKAKEVAVYALAGFIEKRYRNVADGTAEPYWSYVERGGRETGIESAESAEAVHALLSDNQPTPQATDQIGAIRRLFMGLHQQNRQLVDKAAVLQMIALRFPTFTVTESTGYYKGVPEPTLIIEIAAPGGPHLEPLARDLADAFDQDAVGIEAGGVYTRIFGEKKRNTAQLARDDRARLNQFTQALREGQSFSELDAELQAWWINRY